jgi:lysophospholipase L1-like esterase
LFYKKLVELKSIRGVFDYILLNTYSLLDAAAKQKNEKIFALGGFATVDDQIQNFTNLVNFVPSIISLIDPSKSFSAYSFFMRFDWFVDVIENISSNYSLEQEIIDTLKEEYIHMVDENVKMKNYLKENKKYFWPDGMHPNREGHRIIFNKIKEELLDD